MRTCAIRLAIACCVAFSEVHALPLRGQPEDLPAGEKSAEVDREWISIGISILNRGNDSTSGVSDGVGFSLDGGYYLADGDFRPSIEVGGGYSVHDVQGSSSDIDLFRLSLGARVTWDFGTRRVQPYVRGGVFYRWNADSEFDVEPYDQDGTGWYAGLGVDFLTADGYRLGPFVQFFRGTDEDELEETLIGIAVTFEYGGK